MPHTRILQNTMCTLITRNYCVDVLPQAEHRLGSRVRLSHRLLSIKRCASKTKSHQNSHAVNSSLDEWVATFQVDDNIKVCFNAHVIFLLFRFRIFFSLPTVSLCINWIAQKIRSKSIVLAVQSFAAADVLEASTSDAALSHLNVSQADIGRLRSIYYPPVIAVVLAYQNSCFKVSISSLVASLSIAFLPYFARLI